MITRAPTPVERSVVHCYWLPLKLCTLQSFACNRTPRDVSKQPFRCANAIDSREGNSPRREELAQKTQKSTTTPGVAFCSV
ncbi:unnamed protein product [Allacma fusca]|uniref:Uncharacterized protein n=1 Tax=Allacma fusca TaxID=39272 RepID=A0A8J2PF23_9HEXA|nr:unnamed protein product [Allacma fusca]